MIGIRLAVAGIVNCLLVFSTLQPVRAQEPLATPLLRASANGELTIPAWGPFARGNVGPCCLVNRLFLQQFAFPIVISQQREETLVQSSRAADGMVRVHQEPVTLLRRALGLSAVQATDDDRVPAATPRPLNRRALLTEADGNAMLWRAEVDFELAGVAQTITQLPDDSGKPQPTRDWGAGAATMDYFPAFANPEGDGLLIRVALTNRSDSPQTYCVDLLGGLDTQTDDFRPQDLKLEADAQGEGITLQHPRSAPVFALSASALPTPLRAYGVNESYYAPDAAIGKRTESGALQPAGAFLSPPEVDKKRRGKAKPSPALPAPTNGPIWGMLRLSDIAVPPGQTVTFFLCVGIGKDSETARSSAQTLLGLAEDASPNGKLREGAYTLAERAHRANMFAPDNAGISRLMAQALGNVPLIGGRRLGVPSRQTTQGRLPGLYQATLGGIIALAYDSIQPLYEAAELNMWFRSTGNPDVALPNPTPFPPTNLFALWELLQTTHDPALLTRMYPYARRRYLEMLTAGRNKETDWLFGWPTDLPGDVFIPSLFSVPAPQGKAELVIAPDYSAYVIRSANLMRSLATITQRPADEIAGYTRDIQETAKALNDRLWNEKRGLYTPAEPLKTDTVADLLPLIAGAEALPPDRRAALLKALTEPATYWSPYGVRQVAKSSPDYRAADGQRGAVRIGINWLLWKGLLNLGETELAAKLATNVLHGYSAAQAACGGCPEWLDGDTGAPGGVLDYSGDACGVIPLYAAYHVPGTVSTGWNIQILDRRYDAKDGILHIVFRNLDPANKSIIVCALGTPGGRYKAGGSQTEMVTADSDGVVTLQASADSTTQSIDLTPDKGDTK